MDDNGDGDGEGGGGGSGSGESSRGMSHEAVTRVRSVESCAVRNRANASGRRVEKRDTGE